MRSTRGLETRPTSRSVTRLPLTRTSVGTSSILNRAARAGRRLPPRSLLPGAALTETAGLDWGRVGEWYWIGLLVGVGAGFGVLFTGVLSTVRGGVIAAILLAAAAGVAPRLPP